MSPIPTYTTQKVCLKCADYWVNNPTTEETKYGDTTILQGRTGCEAKLTEVDSRGITVSAINYNTPCNQKDSGFCWYDPSRNQYVAEGTAVYKSGDGCANHQYACQGSGNGCSGSAPAYTPIPTQPAVATRSDEGGGNGGGEPTITPTPTTTPVPTNLSLGGRSSG